MLGLVAKFRHHKANSSDIDLGNFSKFLTDPVVSLSFLVLGLVALVLAVLNFVQAVYLY